MSKYIKVKDIKNALIELSKSGKRLERKTTMNIIRALGNLPTIEVSEDCISREYLKSFEYINKGDFNSVETIREWIDNAPSVVPNRAEGKWKSEPDCGITRCIKCGWSIEECIDWNFCPDCGADMRGGE